VTIVPGYEALLFDFDGVIVESVDIKTSAFEALYAEYGEQVVSAVRAYHLAHGGVSRYAKFRHFDTTLLGLPPPCPARERALDERFSALVLEAVVVAPLVAGVSAVLDYYLPRVPMYVVSGTPQDELATIVARRRLGHYFQRLCGSPTTKDIHVATVLAAARHAPERTLLIGDAMTDYAAAISGGTHFLGRVAPATENSFPESVAVIADFRGCPNGSLDGYGLPTR
jgi:beta-phosphoglucomutase-like phosphatase (HAD superfamily)